MITQENQIGKKLEEEDNELEEDSSKLIWS